MGSPVLITSANVESFLSSNTIRTYSPTIAPSSLLNTFPAGFSSTLTPPAWNWASKGTAVESGHSAYYTFERLGAGFAFPTYLPNGSSPYVQRRMRVSASVFSNTADATKVTTNDAWTALTIFDPGNTVANYLLGGQFAQVRHSLTSRTSWSLWVYDGGGGSYSFPFTVPETGSYPQGHRVSITWDCRTEYVSCTVDGITVTATGLPTGSFDGSAVSGSGLMGFTAFAGTTQSAATQTSMNVSSVCVLEFGV